MLKEIFYLNEKGFRENNEDSIYPRPGEANLHNKIFVVCDGVGGENCGEIASNIVSETIGKYLENSTKISKKVIENSILEAVKNLKNYTKNHSEALNMSTTLTLVCLQKEGVWVAWSGDSRIYHIRNEKVLWKSKDHSLVQQLIDSGKINEEESRTHPRKNVILSSINARESSNHVDMVFLSDLRENDYILLCTDGVLESIGELEIKEIFKPNQIQKNKTDLFLNYCEGNSNDNYSLYLLNIDAEFKKDKSLFKFSNYRLTIFLAFLFSIICYLLLFNKEKNIKNKNLNKSYKEVLQDSQKRNRIDTIVKEK